MDFASRVPPWRWGRRYISDFSPSGTLAFNAELPPGITFNRAYRLPWPPSAVSPAGVRAG
jgi:hypothetical protein